MEPAPLNAAAEGGDLSKPTIRDPSRPFGDTRLVMGVRDWTRRAAQVAAAALLAAMPACSEDVVTAAAPAPTATIVPTTADALGGRPKPVTAVSVPTQLYVVQAGDTLFDIAARFGVTVDEIIKTSKLRDPESLHAGQQLLLPIPPPTTTLPGATTTGGVPTTGTSAGATTTTATVPTAAPTPPAIEPTSTVVPAASTVTSAG